MTPFKLRVDWTCHNAYGDLVVVELHRMDEDPVDLVKTVDISSAIDYALRWLMGRGFDYWCDVDLHQRLDHTHITFHPRPRSTTRE
jgi:hypothetical protein